MKRIILYIFAAIALIGCEDIQDNTPAMQGSVNEGFFKATDAIGSLAPGSSTAYLLQGLNSDETLTLGIPSLNSGTNTIGTNPEIYATFKDFTGNLFLTYPDGEGEIVVTNWNTTNKTVTGNFRFTAYSATLDTLIVQRGVFYQVPYDSGIEVEDPGAGNGFLVANIDGELFEPENANGDNNQINIRVRGSENGKILELRIPIDVAVGTHDITTSSFFGKYTDPQGVLEASTSGSITVIAHDTVGRTISGTFGFLTANHTISQGQFNVSY